MTIALHDSLRGAAHPFEPRDPERVTMYVCGPTVYNRIHIGNARPAVVFDVLYRLLRFRYPQVLYARNFTDIDDKIMAAAADEGTDIAELSSRYADAYDEDVRALGNIDPDLAPRATENIDEMLAMIGSLVEKGHAYAAEGHVLFAVESDPGYGALAKRSLEDMVAGARVEVAPYKRHPADFVLWKPSTDDQPGWDSPWGRGRPGWHIECSAMIDKHLGKGIDIHGGGGDLAFPHHENELAQSRCAHGCDDFVRFWMHNGMLTLDGEKMSKSLGNVVTVAGLLEHWDGEVLRYALLSAQYRSPLVWNEALLEQSRASLDRIYGSLRDAGDPEVTGAAPDAAFLAALEDDLNTPGALAALHRIAGELRQAEDEEARAASAATLRASAGLMGLLNRSAEAWFRSAPATGGPTDAEIEALIEARRTARAEKDFARADAIRDELTAAGIELEDTAEGTRWRRALRLARQWRDRT